MPPDEKRKEEEVKTDDTPKETYETLDEAFQQEPEAAPKVSAEEAADAELDKRAEEKPAELSTSQEEVKEDTWANLGLDKFEGKSRAEIAAALKQEQTEADYRKAKFGELSNEVGRLRQEVADKKEPAPAPKEPTTPFADLPEMSEGQMLEFQKLYDVNPVKAIGKFFGPHLQTYVAEQVKAQMAEGMEGPMSEVLSKQVDQIDLRNLLVSHSDAKELLPQMAALDDAAYLGPQHRAHEELYSLAKLGQAEDPAYTATYANMRDYPQMSFATALSYARSQIAGTQEETDTEKEKLKDEINKVESVSGRKAVKAAAGKVEVFASTDEAFDSVNDDDSS